MELIRTYSSDSDLDSVLGDEDLVLTPTPRPQLPFLRELRSLSATDHLNLTDTGVWGGGSGYHVKNCDMGRWRSHRRAVPSQSSATKDWTDKEREWWGDIPRGFLGQVRETIRFNREVQKEDLRRGVETRKNNRKINMKLVNKEY